MALIAETGRSAPSLRLAVRHVFAERFGTDFFDMALAVNRVVLISTSETLLVPSFSNGHHHGDASVLEHGREQVA